MSESVTATKPALGGMPVGHFNDWLSAVRVCLHYAIRGAEARTPKQHELMLMVADAIDGGTSTVWRDAVERTWKWNICEATAWCGVRTAGRTAKLCPDHGGPAHPTPTQGPHPTGTATPSEGGPEDRCGSCGRRGVIGDDCPTCVELELWWKGHR